MKWIMFSDDVCVSVCERVWACVCVCVCVCVCFPNKGWNFLYPQYFLFKTILEGVLISKILGSAQKCYVFAKFFEKTQKSAINN